ncbi:dehydrogenase [soil metagenome]
MKILLCGFGSIGRRHFANARTFVQDAVFTIVEPVPALHTADAHFVQSLAEATGEFDVAMICSPTASHAEQIEALAGRVKAFFIEKPLAHDRAALATIRRALDGQSVRTMVGSNYRFETGLAKVKALLDSNTIGKPLSMRAEFGQWLPSWRPTADYRQGYAARRSTGGGIILDRIHELDYMLWLFGVPTQVKAMAGKLSSLDIETEDTAEIMLRFPGGAIGSIHVDYLQREYVCSLKIVGEHGTIEWRFKPTSVRVLDEAGRWDTVFEDLTPDVNAMYIAELHHFFGALERGERPANDVVEAGHTLDVALSALEQM